MNGGRGQRNGTTFTDESRYCQQHHDGRIRIWKHRSSSVSWGKLPTRTTQPTSRIGILTSTFAGLKEDTCTKDSLAADQHVERALVFVMAWSADCFTE
ncbi:hypothetical protein TNCV_687801 [Trichonephila clavipes]|nr:hypothetical protein TNCV_687801 [Trichonephila clavipes]